MIIIYRNNKKRIKTITSRVPVINLNLRTAHVLSYLLTHNLQ